jgi:hypothetical protein
MNRNGWITSVIEMDEVMTSPDSFFAQQTKTSYTTGMLQPGVVALRGSINVFDERAGSGAGVGAVPLVTWGSIPTRANVNGAVGRLSASRAWAAVQLSLGGDFSIATPATDQMSRRVPIFLLYFLLMANGNFLEPRTFTNDAGGTHGGHGASTKMKRAAAKALLALGVLGVGVAKAPISTASIVAVYVSYFFFTPGGPWHILSTVFQPTVGRGGSGASKL